MFIRGFEPKKESKITKKKVDFGSFYAFKKVVLKISNLDFSYQDDLK